MGLVLYERRSLLDATFAVAKRKPEKKFRFVRDSNP